MYPQQIDATTEHTKSFSKLASTWLTYCHFVVDFVHLEVVSNANAKNTGPKQSQTKMQNYMTQRRQQISTRRKPQDWHCPTGVQGESRPTKQNKSFWFPALIFMSIFLLCCATIWSHQTMNYSTRYHLVRSWDAAVDRAAWMFFERFPKLLESFLQKTNRKTKGRVDQKKTRDLWNNKKQKTNENDWWYYRFDRNKAVSWYLVLLTY